MKKIMLILSTLILFINSVKAEEYSDWVEWLDNSIKYDDVETETRYRFYKEEIEGEYLTSDTLNKYQYQDIEKFIYSEFSNWQETCNGENINIENKLLYPYKKLIVDTNYIYIDELYNDINNNNIKIYSNGIEVPYTFEVCENCVNNYNYIKKGEKIILKLDKNYPSKSLTFYIDANSEYPNVTYKLKTTYDKDGTKLALVKIANTNLKDFIPNDRWFYLAMESDIMYSETPVLEDENTIIYPSKNMCRYQEKMTYFYNINKVYYDNNYYTNIEGYIKDTNDYKVYYRYLIKDDNEEIIEDSNSTLNNNKVTNTNINNNSSNNGQEVEDENINKENIDNNDLSTINVSDNIEKENKKTPLVNTMSINKKVPLIKYIILLVIILTLIFIFYQNKKYRKKMSLE